MSVIEVDKLLEPVSTASPCGPDLDEDPAFQRLEEAARGKPERVMGATVIPAEKPNWRQVCDLSLELLSRSKDLRTAVYLTRALINTDGFPGLCDGLALVRGLLTLHWEHVHPQLDPLDGNDPTTRVLRIAELAHPETVLHNLREVPLARAPGIGTASLRDVLVATGKLNSPPAEGAVPLSPSDIEAAFRSTDLEELRAAESAVEKAVRLAGEIEATLTARVGASQSANLEGLVRTLEDTRGVLSLELAKRGSGDVATPASAGAGSASTRATSVPVPSGAARPGLGGIQSNEDVLRALDMVCEYFERHEPSSPVALLVRRAKRLVSKSFMEIMRDVAPDGVRQAKTILGVEDET